MRKILVKPSHLLILALFFMSCGQGDQTAGVSSGGASSAAGYVDTELYTGTYTVDSTICASTGQKPNYGALGQTDTAQSIAYWKDFTLDSRTIWLDLTTYSWARTYVLNNSCSLVITGSLATFDLTNGNIRETLEQTHVWNPVGCGFYAASGDTATFYDASFFLDISSKTAGPLMELTKIFDTPLKLQIRSPAFNFTARGCSVDDSFITTLTKTN